MIICYHNIQNIALIICRHTLRKLVCHGQISLRKLQCFCLFEVQNNLILLTGYHSVVTGSRIDICSGDSYISNVIHQILAGGPDKRLLLIFFFKQIF